MTSSRLLYLGYCLFLVVAYLCLLGYQLLTPAPILMYLFMAFHAIAFVYGWRSWVARRRADKNAEAEFHTHSGIVPHDEIIGE